MQIYIGTYQGSVAILYTDFNTIKPIRNLKISDNSIKTICVLDHNNLVAGGYDQELRVIDLNTHQQKIQAKENTGQITSLAKVNDKLFLIGVEDGSIRLWNTQNWNMVSQARFHKKSINSIILMKQGRLMISAGGNKVILWHATNLRKAHEYKLDKDIIIEKLRITEDTQYIYYSTSKGEIWKVNTENNEKKLVLKMPTPRKIQDFIIHSDFTIVANDSGEIMAWRRQQQEEEGNQKYEHRIWFKAHNSRIKQLKIVNNSYLLVVTAAGDVSIWDFPQFLQSVEHISQNYNLEGLTPLCSLVIKGRILCVDALVKDDNVEHEEQNQYIQEEVRQEQNIRKSSKQVENKKIKKIKKKKKDRFSNNQIKAQKQPTKIKTKPIKI